jgi:hypothetical protein
MTKGCKQTPKSVLLSSSHTASYFCSLLAYIAIGSIVCLSLVEPLPMESHHLFVIFILAETIDMQVSERTVDKIKKW